MTSKRKRNGDGGKQLDRRKGGVTLISGTTKLVRHAFREAIAPAKGFVVNDGPANKSIANTTKL